MNKRYDLVSIIRPALDEPSIDSIHKEISDIIETSGGEVLEQGVWQRKKLAYEIDGNKEGIYTITTFEGPSNVPSEVDRVLKISDDVIRHKVLKVES
jgi:small subunit ribosomal protein S6|tara:strand:+ start:3235 stop:3525 length:291 start_codon:yes stop_codon:yes gene_type:complete